MSDTNGNVSADHVEMTWTRLVPQRTASDPEVPALGRDEDDP
jgi:hypothetical protein